MTNFEEITQSLERLTIFIDHATNPNRTVVGCPPDDWACQMDVNEHCHSCRECWRLWLEEESDECAD